MSQIQFVCFTYNNYPEEKYVELLEWEEWRYVVIGKEVGESGTPHLQGYGELKKRKRFDALKRKWPAVHWEQRRANRDTAAAYCKKEGRYEERGTLPQNASAKSSKEAVARVKKGESMRSIMDDPPNLSGIRVCQLWLSYCEPKRSFKSEVHWIYGPSGSGKTRLAAAEAGEDSYWHDGTKWFDGYDAHENMVLDDFRAGNMKFNFLLKMLDRYPLRLECKGGYRQLLSKKIIITSIKHPRDCYQQCEHDEPMQQLLRRIEKVTKLCICAMCKNCGNTSTILHSQQGPDCEELHGYDVCGNN
ncbi:Rep [Tadarida brasiliensis associated circovirus 1]|nr:Rep [Tadarida brasiliensis associated circovirus 1]UJO02100.1 Rep [Tadarida brasiliensis associated circovirus 1]